ncbi:MAG: methyltransferase domain-containing protein [Leptolyngbyaceae bacterium]|nr:methyltransferase domain-containing protein [Leptolyngbyaceae bacterium]
MSHQTTSRICWCGNTNLSSFSPDYGYCSVCGTLVSQRGLTEELMQVSDDSQDFYGKEYWFSHQVNEYGQPDIVQRSRQDLPERCVHWLRTLLKYKLPPAKVLELGSAHGGFVALMQWAGFDAMGLELSPWIVEYAKETFHVPMLQGTLEHQTLESGSLDAVVLFDVLEHLDHPFESMQLAANLLKPDGVFMVQMPNYPDGKTYDEMVAEGDRFLEQMKAIEHLHLLSHRAAEEFFNRLGFTNLTLEQELYSYDMFLVASRQPMSVIEQENIDNQLLSTSEGRIVLALIDKAKELEISKSALHEVSVKYHASENDRINRLDIINYQVKDLSQLNTTIQSLREKLEQQNQKVSQQNEKSRENRRRLRSRIKKLQGKLKSKNKEIDALNVENENIKQENSSIKSSKIWRIKEKLKSFKTIFPNR